MSKRRRRKSKNVDKMFKKLEEQRKKYPVYYFFHDVYRRIYNFIDDIPLNVKSFIQRGKRGYANRDVWELCNYLADVISKSVYHLKKRSYGYPSDLTEGQWVDILNEIRDTFDTAKRIGNGTLYLIEDKKKRNKWQIDLDDLNKKYKEYDRCMSDEEIKQYERGWRLFRKYFFSLWD